MRRPSESSAVIASSETSTSSIVGSATVLLPGFDNQWNIRGYQLTDLDEIMAAEAMVGDQRDRLNPELTDAPVPLNMDMHRLSAVEAVEEEPEPSRDTTNGWHVGHLC
jgi:hypothetical protein